MEKTEKVDQNVITLMSNNSDTRPRLVCFNFPTVVILSCLLNIKMLKWPETWEKRANVGRIVFEKIEFEIRRQPTIDPFSSTSINIVLILYQQTKKKKNFQVEGMQRKNGDIADQVQLFKKKIMFLEFFFSSKYMFPFFSLKFENVYLCEFYR